MLKKRIRETFTGAMDNFVIERLNDILYPIGQDPDSEYAKAQDEAVALYKLVLNKLSKGDKDFLMDLEAAFNHIEAVAIMIAYKQGLKDSVEFKHVLNSELGIAPAENGSAIYGEQ